jgi:glutaredoxin 3
MYVVYTKNDCPNCIQAKNILKVKNKEFREVSVEGNEEMKDMLASLGFRSMPQIFDEDKQEFIQNGHLGLMKMMREGKL